MASNQLRAWERKIQGARKKQKRTRLTPNLTNELTCQRKKHAEKSTIEVREIVCLIFSENNWSKPLEKGVSKYKWLGVFQKYKPKDVLDIKLHSIRIKWWAKFICPIELRRTFWNGRKDSQVLS